MADIKISELTQAESLSTSDLLESAVPYNGGFLSRRMSLAQLSNYLENYVQHQALDTTTKTIVGAINEVVGDLANNYYKTTETYSKTQVDQLIAGVSGLHFEVVSQLPTTDIDMNTIYLVPKQDVGTQDIYDEYICLDDTTTPATWEKIGTTEIDLSDYVTDTELTNILNDYVTSSGLSTILASYATTSAMTTALADKVDKVSGKGLSTEDYTTAEKTKVNGLATVATSGSYNDLSNTPTIPTVNNNTISITQNGTAVDSFTLNQNSNKTIDVKDEKVKQTQISSSDNNYPLLLAYSANGTEETQYTWKDTNLTLNPSMKQFTYDGAIRGNIFEFYLHGISVGSISYNSSNNSVVTLPASSGTLALQSDITSAINDLDVASTSISASETLATIKEEDGKVSVTTQDISIKSNQIENYCMVGTASSISSGVTWYKVASTTLTITNDDAIIMFAVQDAYIPDTDANSDSNGGILYCRVRQGNPVGTHNYGKLKFVANSGLDANDFRLYYTITSGTSITYEIWTSMNRRYAFRKFVVLSQSNRYQATTEKWTLYNSTSPSSAPTESATCVRVECEDNTYKQTDNDTLGATNLIPYPYSSPSNYSNNYVTISADKKGTITATGVSPASGFGYQICSKTDAIILDPTKSYIMSGLSNGSSSTIRFLLDLWTEDQNPAIDSYTTRLYQATTETTIPSGYKYLQITLYFYTGAGSKLPLTVSPMLRLATIADSTFKVYSASNRQLSIRKVDYTQIATYEMSDITSRAYQKNELMFFDGKLYRVTQAISNGGTIIRSGSGANITSTTLSAEIKAIRDALNI